MAAIIIIVAIWFFCLPRDLFKGAVYSSVVLDRSGELLGARIADDGQWRFPPVKDVPEKYEKALIQFEDKNFRYHFGVDPVAVGRALIQNVRAKRVVSGASTITMQVIRLSRGKERSIWQKMTEAFLATRLEARLSKDKILALYASHAPFGGNVIGIEAAAWRYFGRSANELSWSEAAMLAVLPNSPSLIHPGKNRSILKDKRDALLKRLYEKGYMDETDLKLAIEEPLPGAPLPLPSLASHYVDACSAKHHGEKTTTTIDINLQRQVEDIADRWNEELSMEGIADLAVIVLDVPTGEILSYVGNANPSIKRPGADVDIASSPRSTGSILKPFLYRACLNDGEILPYTLLPDIPMSINGFAPRNFDREFSGAIPADKALARSLNIPAVHLLKNYGVPRFCNYLKNSGMTTLTRDADDYGLSLILGGAEGKLSEIVGMYRNLALDSDDISAWYTLEALSDVSRPDEMDWRRTRSLRKVAWKTGTSYGFRDAWAVGATPQYVVGVWAGNALGTGVQGLVGARTAGPVMFDVFNILPRGEWFGEPSPKTYMWEEVCRESGCLAGLHCEHIDTLRVPLNADKSRVCPYHIVSGGEECFVLPPAMEYYYKRSHPGYKGAKATSGTRAMEFIYPANDGAIINIPRQNDGSIGGVTFSLAHTGSGSSVHWHLDSSYIATTEVLHQVTVIPEPGKHILTVVDDEGNSLSISFRVVE